MSQHKNGEQCPEPSSEWIIPEFLNDVLESEDQQIAIDILRLFIEDFARKLTVLRLAVDRSDWAECRRIAHNAKGSAAQIGAAGIARSSLSLETVLSRAPSAENSGTCDALRDAIEEMTSQFAEVKRKILTRLDA